MDTDLWPTPTTFLDGDSFADLHCLWWSNPSSKFKVSCSHISFSGSPCACCTWGIPGGPPRSHTYRDSAVPTCTGPAGDLSSLQDELVLDELERRASCRLKIVLDISGWTWILEVHVCLKFLSPCLCLFWRTAADSPEGNRSFIFPLLAAFSMQWACRSLLASVSGL